ncbi:uncharacterized protein LOC114728534 [Neltuma alba]|uniref:uncharacterized protein LOC114728534 n=1 Tax=Neltuma alba TaxID=207710 RepID=UPI0010A59B1D|nr:uncharacterized protein LOC114728534 [Prosopis alba]
MASSSTIGLGKALLNRGIRRLTTSTTPKTKAYAPAADYGYAHHHQKRERMPAKGDFVPVYVAIGMIALSTGLGLVTAWHQLRTSPTVSVKKQRRETLPEVVEPEHVAEESEKFFKGSFFRRIAHIQDKNNPEKHVIPDPIRSDAYASPRKIETLKSVGVDPAQV